MPEVTIKVNIDTEAIGRYQQLVAGTPIPPVVFEDYAKISRELIELLEVAMPHKHLVLQGGGEHVGDCTRCKFDRSLSIMDLHTQMLAATINIIHTSTAGELGWGIFAVLVPSDPEADVSSN